MKVELSGSVMFLSPEERFRGDVDVPCHGCPAPCCRTNQHTVFISHEESMRLPFQVKDVFLRGEDRHFENVAVLGRHPNTGDCIFLSEKGTCGIWDKRPRMCREYDCRDDKAMSKFTDARFDSKGRLKNRILEIEWP